MPDKTLAQPTAMDASNSITAAAFSAFLKCPTKGHLVAIGEPAPSAFFSDIEMHMASRYKAAAKRRLPIDAEIGDLLDFGQLRRSLSNETITYYIDCDTAAYDLTLPSQKTGRRQLQETS